jgi:hypothetical protein
MIILLILFSFKSTIEKNHLIGHKNGIWWKIELMNFFPFLCRKILFNDIVCNASFFQTLYNVMIWRIVLLNKADLHDITEILLKVALNTIKQTNTNKQTYFLNLVSCSEHFISIKHRILATWIPVRYILF